MLTCFANQEERNDGLHWSNIEYQERELFIRQVSFFTKVKLYCY